ncbi:hypothetical protein [Candidatus Paracaedibacter symbiosus]|uniref:hypothetical protein n=1 Tax=Candidatus Paracaedibacter symbiosus TaxID=244582 RepID=UPI0005099524|nr:hypothetical protein [Candidatus Paracaedibacter symbiosus]
MTFSLCSLFLIIACVSSGSLSPTFANENKDNNEEIGLSSLKNSRSDSIILTRELVEDVCRDLLHREDEKSPFTYHHSNPPANDMKDLYAQLIEKGHRILTHIYTTDQAFEHEFKLFQNYGDYSSHYLPHGLTFGGISLLIGPDETTLTKQRAYLESITCVLWALIDKAYKRGDIVDRGAIIIPDLESIPLLNFFKCYALDVSGCADWESFIACKNPLFASNRAYSRTGKGWTWIDLSSHFVERTEYQFGIDCRFGPSEHSMPYFPFAMEHLLIGKVKTLDGKVVMFIKPEPRGLGDWCSHLSHTFEYFWNGQGFYLRREKDIHKDIAPLALKLAQDLLATSSPESDKLPLFKTFQTLEAEKSLILKTFLKSEKIDIASLISLTNAIQQLPDSAVQPIALELKNKITEIYKNNLDYRTGNEIIFTAADFLPPPLKRQS